MQKEENRICRKTESNSVAIKISIECIWNSEWKNEDKLVKLEDKIREGKKALSAI